MHNPAWRDRSTGCIRTDIQDIWKATVGHYSTLLYMSPGATEAEAATRARTIWTHARENPRQVVMKKLVDASEPWPTES